MRQGTFKKDSDMTNDQLITAMLMTLHCAGSDPKAILHGMPTERLHQVSEFLKSFTTQGSRTHGTQ